MRISDWSSDVCSSDLKRCSLPVRRSTQTGSVSTSLDTNGIQLSQNALAYGGTDLQHRFVAGSGYAHCADFSGFAAIFRRHCQMHLACRKVGGFGCQLFMHFSPFQINSRVIRDDHEGHSCSCSMPSEMLPLGGEHSRAVRLSPRSEERSV